MTLQRATKLLLLVALVASLMGILAGHSPRVLAMNPQKGETPKAGSVSKEDCAVCHEDQAKAFDRNPHSILEKSSKFNVKNPCEACHGPGEAHASNGGDKTQIISFKGAKNKAYNGQCLACHKKDHELTGFNPGSQHAKAGLSCADCHGVHESAPRTRLLKASETTLCEGCHVQKRAEFSRPFHHRVPEGAVRCTDCHQPHGGLDRHQVRISATGETPCSRCHAEKEGPFVFEHAALEIRDCGACHEPHGSNNAKMLVRSNVRQLCLECHSASTNVLSAQPPAFHDVRSPRYQNCTTCHARIHGSNSSPLFLR